MLQVFGSRFSPPEVPRSPNRTSLQRNRSDLCRVRGNVGHSVAPSVRSQEFGARTFLRQGAWVAILPWPEISSSNRQPSPALAGLPLLVADSGSRGRPSNTRSGRPRLCAATSATPRRTRGGRSSLRGRTCRRPSQLAADASPLSCLGQRHLRVCVCCCLWVFRHRDCRATSASSLPAGPRPGLRRRDLLCPHTLDKSCTPRNDDRCRSPGGQSE